MLAEGIRIGTDMEKIICEILKFLCGDKGVCHAWTIYYFLTRMVLVEFYSDIILYQLMIKKGCLLFKE